MPDGKWKARRFTGRIRTKNRVDNQGVGLGFGPDVTKRWCDLNKITAVIRSHEVRQDGYAIEHDGLCITTFSCPNYCDTTGNKVRPLCYLNFSRTILMIRLHMSECNLMVNCHIINSTLYPIQQLNRWLTRLGSISCLACRTLREVDGIERSERGEGEERRGEETWERSCPLHSLHSCTHAPLHRPTLHPLISYQNKLPEQSTNPL
jgi:hypothetical protein